MQIKSAAALLLFADLVCYQIYVQLIAQDPKQWLKSSTGGTGTHRAYCHN